MSDIVFILGAGASKEAGVPLMDGFLDKARELYSARKIENEYKKYFEAVFKGISILQNVHSKAELDI